MSSGSYLYDTLDNSFNDDSLLMNENDVSVVLALSVKREGRRLLF